MIHATVARASRWPNAGRPVLRDDDDEIIERKLPTNGFPYAVRYRIVNDRLLVVAVLHQHRRPDFGPTANPDPVSDNVASARSSGAPLSFGLVSRVDSALPAHSSC